MTLREIALKHGTDKAGGSTDPGRHEYCEAYEQFLGHLKHRAFTLLELGVGGEEYADRGGQSLRTWREYFANATIHGVDLYKKTFEIPGCSIHMGSQDDEGFLNDLIYRIGSPDVIIDDASHINRLTITTFLLLFPKLKRGGIYVVEDTHTSYWEHIYGGGWHSWTATEFFKHQTDGLNKVHWRDKDPRMSQTEIKVEPSEEIPDGSILFDYPLIPDIESITFFKEIIFIRKKQ